MPVVITGRSSKLFKSRLKKSKNLPSEFIRSEHQEAIALAGYLLLLQRQGKIQLYTHIPHETYTASFNQRRKNSQEGVRRGIPDYIIVTQAHVLFIELKRTKGSTTSIEQGEWLLNLKNKRTESFLAKGYEQAKLFIDGYID